MSQVVSGHHEVEQGSVRSYTIGFVVSLVLTIVAYILASHQLAANWTLVYLLSVLAVSQLFVQLVFFLHLGRGSSARWNLALAAFAAMVVLILVFGSLWIMHHLNAYHNQLTPQQITKDEGIQPSKY